MYTLAHSARKIVYNSITIIQFFIRPVLSTVGMSTYDISSKNCSPQPIPALDALDLSQKLTHSFPT